MFKVLSSLNCVVATVSLLAGLLAVGWNVTAAFEDDKVSDEGDNGHSVKAAGLSTVFQVTIGTIAIVGAEMTIKVNEIDLSDSSLASSGQLVPFVIGVFTVCVTVGAGIRNFLTGAPGLPMQIQYFKQRVRILGVDE